MNFFDMGWSIRGNKIERIDAAAPPQLVDCKEIFYPPRLWNWSESATNCDGARAFIISSACGRCQNANQPPTYNGTRSVLLCPQHR